MRIQAFSLSRLSWLLSRCWRLLQRYKFCTLLVFQLLFIFIYPLVEGSFLEWLLHVVITFIFLFVAYLCFSSRLGNYVNGTIGILLAVIYGLDYLKYYTDIPFPIEGHLFQLFYDVGFTLYFLYLTLVTGFHMLTDKEPHVDTLAGTASVYLMVGITWAYAYMNLEDLIPGSFQSVAGESGINFINWLFYSVGTLVSASYNDVSPVSDYAKCINILESVIGALYIAIITARIVGLPFSQEAYRSTNK
jgi:voltage-gated potassium channel